MTIAEYIPRQPRRIPLRNIGSLVARRMRRAATVLGKIVVPFEESPQAPQQDYPDSDSEMAEAQVKQCERLFNYSDERAKSLDVRVDALLKVLGLVVPVALAALTYLWRESGLLPRIGLVAAFVCLFGSLAAVLRAGGIGVRHVPGIDAVVDVTNHIRRPYNAAREGYGLLWCGMMNNAASDLKYDFLRAGRILVSGALILLLSSALIALSRGSQPRVDAIGLKPRSQQTTVAQQIVELSRLHAQRVDQLEELIAQHEKVLAEAKIELKRLRELGR